LAGWGVSLPRKRQFRN